MASLMDKEKVICDLFQQCGHQQQLLLLEKLSLYLKRDFISLLPPEIAVIILSYLEPINVVKYYMLVSWSWYRRLKSCEPYWREQLYKLHRSEARWGGHSYMEATLSVLKLEKHLQLLTSHAFHPLVPHPDVAVYPIGSSSKWLYCYCNKTRMFFICHVSLRERFHLPSLEEIKWKKSLLWSWSSDTGALLYMSDAVWVFIKYPDITSPLDFAVQLEVRAWDDTEIYGPAHFAFGGCSDCRLVIICTKHMYHEDSSEWAVELVILQDDHHITKKQTLVFNFLPSPEFANSVLFTIRSVMLVSAKQPELPFCSHHFLYIQIGTGVLKTELVHTPENIFQLFQPLATYCPSSVGWTDVGFINQSNLKMDSKKSLIALIPNQDCLFVQDLIENKSYNHKLHFNTINSDVFLIRVDCLYTIIGLVKFSLFGQFEVFIISTTTGRVVFRCSLRDSGRIDRLLPGDCLEQALRDEKLLRSFDLCTIDYSDSSSVKKLTISCRSSRMF